MGWILAEQYWPFQRNTFVTPPFAGYISGHSTYSRAAAEALTLVTGDEYFPGGMGEFHIQANSGFLGVEKGPSVDITLQWATYRDASDQTSLSRIWGGIHPPEDDIPGRRIGAEVGTNAFVRARQFFYFNDSDQDGYPLAVDCDDANPDVHPNAPEVCDGMDNNCNGDVDDGLPFTIFYEDQDGDGFGASTSMASFCTPEPPAGFVGNALDCDDGNATVNPDGSEGSAPDGLDNDCNGLVDDFLSTQDLEEAFSLFPNPVRDQMTVKFGSPLPVEVVYVLDQQGRLWHTEGLPTGAEGLVIDFTTAPTGIYGLYVLLEDGRRVWLGTAVRW